MSHQPFENWILENEGLTAGERRELQVHLSACGQCQRLERKWQAVHQELRAHRVAAPAPGFTQRWQASLAERRAREQRKQAWRIFGILMAGALFVLLILAGYVLATTSPAQWLVALTRTVSSSQAFLELAIYIVQTWVSSTPLALNIALWIYLTVTLCILSLVWLGILWRTKNVGVLNQ